MRKLSEAEWISRFEQVQGRKPKPDELQLAYQSGLIGISKNYNYKSKKIAPAIYFNRRCNFY